jgi:hypothetical protein
LEQIEKQGGFMADGKFVRCLRGRVCVAFPERVKKLRCDTLCFIQVKCRHFVFDSVHPLYGVPNLKRSIFHNTLGLK